jgi:beta-1,4-mannosyl-glycoprotein beta-1,4-N-acetylglucosaminyltransferase
MAIYDVFPIFNELDLLEIRLNLLSPHVDYFVISESTTTFSGLTKPLYFEASRDRFSEFGHKIIHNVVTDEFEGSPFERDRFQKDRIKQVLAERCSGSDLIVFSDLDEIPNPRTFDVALESAVSGKMAHFAQDLFFYYLNLMEISGSKPSITGDYPGIRDKKWLGSRVTTFDYMAGFTMTELRDPFHKEGGTRVADGGWHFSYCGSANNDSVEDRVKLKVQSTPHQELVTKRNLRKLSKRISRAQDPFGRRGTKLRKIEIEEHLPTYLSENRGRYSHMILP